MLPLERQDSQIFGPPGKPSAWLAVSGKALGELEANPQLNCYRWCWQVPQPPKPEFPRLNTQSGVTHASKRPARPTLVALLHPLLLLGNALGAFRALHATAGSEEDPTRPLTCASQLHQACCWVCWGLWWGRWDREWDREWCRG
jgi:hypothetical protein